MVEDSDHEDPRPVGAWMAVDDGGGRPIKRKERDLWRFRCAHRGSASGRGGTGGGERKRGGRKLGWKDEGKRRLLATYFLFSSIINHQTLMRGGVFIGNT